jgi:hypothetical protein
MFTSRIAAAVGVALLLLSGLPGVRASGDIQSLSWGQLVPSETAAPAGEPKRPAWLPPRRKEGDPLPPPPGSRDEKWMSRKQSRLEGPPPVVKELDGKRVRMGGYVVPLDFDATTIKEFLLVPFVGACIHVPPPPANQIVYVKAEKGVTIKETFDPVYVTGTMRIETQMTGLADAAYTLIADAVELRPAPEAATPRAVTGHGGAQ